MSSDRHTPPASSPPARRAPRRPAGLRRTLPELESLPRPLYARAETLRAGSFSEPHRHRWAQFSYAIAGVLEVRTPQGNYVALPQCAVLIPADVEHQVITLAHSELRSFYLDPAALPAQGERCRVLRVTPLARELIRAASALPAEYPEQGAEARLVQVLLDQLAVLPDTDVSLPMPHDPRLLALCQGLQAQPDDPRTLAQWAGAVGASERNLARLFRRQTGLSFRLWRQRLRLMLSLGGLERGRSVTQVALDCGYASPSAFIAAFRCLFGYTPGELFGRAIA